MSRVSISARGWDQRARVKWGLPQNRDTSWGRDHADACILGSMLVLLYQLVAVHLFGLSGDL